MKTAEEWVEHLGMGVWASDIIEIQKDVWEAACEAQRDLCDNYLSEISSVDGVSQVELAPFPSEAK